MKYCNNCKAPAFDEQNYCQKCGNNTFSKSIKNIIKKEQQEQKKIEYKEKISTVKEKSAETFNAVKEKGGQVANTTKEFATDKTKQAKNLIEDKAIPVTKEQFENIKENAIPIAKKEATKIKEKSKEIVGEGTYQDKAKNILQWLKVLITVRFVKFLKNYKRFKELPKQSKIKHICFPVVLILIIIIGTNSTGGSTEGLTREESIAVLTVSALNSDMQNAAKYGSAKNVTIGSLSKIYTIKDCKKEKIDKDTYKITVHIYYELFGGNGSAGGTLEFKYNKKTNQAELTGGTAYRPITEWATYYAVN